jgi:ParB family chromosome partitioning protein
MNNENKRAKELRNLNVDKIIAEDNPRLSFEGKEFNILVDSIKEHGILQPLVVNQVNSEFVLIAGERRLRAAQKLGLQFVLVKEIA